MNFGVFTGELGFPVFPACELDGPLGLMAAANSLFGGLELAPEGVLERERFLPLAGAGERDREGARYRDLRDMGIALCWRA